MKALHNLLDSVRPHFEEGGKLSKFWVVYDSLETFAFTPGHATKNGVHIRDGVDLKRTMFMVIVALIPALGVRYMEPRAPVLVVHRRNHSRMIP